MSTPLERAIQLIEMATNSTTPVEEARNAAFQAARIIKREGFLEKVANYRHIIESSPDIDVVDDYDVPSFTPDDFSEEVTPFGLGVAEYNLTCARCSKEIRKGTSIAHELYKKKGERKNTHFECRVYFTQTNKR